MRWFCWVSGDEGGGVGRDIREWLADQHTGRNDKFRNMKMRYPFHCRSVISVGPIIATKKFQSQFAEIPMALLYDVSRVVSLTCNFLSLIRGFEVGSGWVNLDSGLGLGSECTRNVSGTSRTAYPFVRTCMGRSSGP